MKQGDRVTRKTSDFDTHQKIYRELFLKVDRNSFLYEISVTVTLVYWLPIIKKAFNYNTFQGNQSGFRMVTTGHR